MGSLNSWDLDSNWVKIMGGRGVPGRQIYKQNKDRKSGLLLTQGLSEWGTWAAGPGRSRMLRGHRERAKRWWRGKDTEDIRKTWQKGWKRKPVMFSVRTIYSVFFRGCSADGCCWTCVSLPGLASISYGMKAGMERIPSCILDACNSVQQAKALSMREWWININKWKI